MGKREIEKYILKNKENMYRIRKELFENPEIGLKEKYGLRTAGSYVPRRGLFRY